MAVDKVLLQSLPLGMPPSHWDVVRLRDVTSKIGSGATPSGGEKVYQSEGVALIRSQNVYDNDFHPEGLAYIDDAAARKLDSVTVQPGDVLLNITGDSIARCCLVPKWVLPARVNQHVAIIRPTGRLDGIFLQKYLTHPNVKAYMLGHDAGGTRKALTKGHIENFLMPLPPLPEQRAIASILSSLDDKIELNRRMNATLEAMAQALFKSWFVDFDPVRARAQGRQPVGMDAELAALFPESFQDSPIGTTPTGWQTTTIGDLLELAYGKALKEDVRRPGQVPVYGSNGRIGWHSEFIVQGPGIVVGRKGNPGVVTWVPQSFFPIDTTFYVVPTGSIQSLVYLYHMLKLQELSDLGADSAVPGLNRNMAYMSRVLVPPQELIALFDRQAQFIFSTVSRNEEQSRTLASLRDTLLPKLLSGEIRVEMADQIMATLT